MKWTDHWLVRVGATVLAIVLVWFGAQWYAQSSAEQIADEAVKRFGGDRTQALIALVDCDKCDVHERERAVTALGRLHANSALTALKKYATGQKCVHGRDICQRTLRQAINRIEGRWEAGVSLDLAHGLTN